MTDTGIGIAEHQHQAVFEAFRRRKARRIGNAWRDGSRHVSISTPN